MATPKDSGPPSKANPPAKGAATGKPGVKPAAKGPVKAGDGAQASKKPAGATPAPAPRPQPRAPERDVETKGTTGRKIGQVLVDLGFIDEDQLWEILDEAKNTGGQTGQVALSRGLINEDQLLQALAEQYGLKIV